MLGQCSELLQVLLRAKGDKLGLRLDHCRAAWTTIPFPIGGLAREHGDIELVASLRVGQRRVGGDLNLFEQECRALGLAVA